MWHLFMVASLISMKVGRVCSVDPIATEAFETSRFSLREVN